MSNNVWNIEELFLLIQKYQKGRGEFVEDFECLIELPYSTQQTSKFVRMNTELSRIAVVASDASLIADSFGLDNTTYEVIEHPQDPLHYYITANERFDMKQRFRKTNLQQVNLKGAKLMGVNLKGADLWWASFTDCDLKGADLRGASLFGTAFHNCNLSNTQWKGATNVEGMEVIGCDLKGADLRGMDLGKSSWDDSTFEGVLIDSSTELREASLEDVEDNDDTRQGCVLAPVQMAQIGVSLATATDMLDTAIHTLHERKKQIGGQQ